MSIGLDEAAFPSRWAYPCFHCFLYSSLATGLGSSSHPNFLQIYHTVACARRRTGEFGKSMWIRLFSRPFRSTVSRLISAPCKSSSSRRKIYLVLQSCLFYVPNPDLHTISLARHSLATDARALNLKGVYCAFTAKQSASQMLLF